MDPRFVHLRIHSEFSLVDGIVRIKPLIKKLTGFQMPAAAVTEQCNLFSLVKFYKAAQAAGIKPIAGADVWIYNPEEPAKPYRLTLLARNQPGYVTLTELVSQGYQQGQHQGIPMLQKEWLAANHQGLIVLSGAMQGDVGSALLAENRALAKTCAQYWAGLFPDCFYLEVQRVGKADEERYIKLAVELATELDLPVVATNDVRFLDKHDFDAHEVRVCIHQGRVLDDARRPRDYTEQQYLRSQKEMVELFSDLPEALQNSVEIAKRCTVELRLGENFLPDFEVPQGLTLADYFKQASRSGLEERLQQHPPSARAASKKIARLTTSAWKSS
jgi:DNA polymerase-3 subunit alpha